MNHAVICSILLVLPLLAIAGPAHAEYLPCVKLLPNCTPEPGVPNCHNDNQSDGQHNDEYMTTCGDGYTCTMTDHYNDPAGSTTTYNPPGCQNDPRWGW